MTASAAGDRGDRPFLRIAVIDSGVNPRHRQVGLVAPGVAISARGARVGLSRDWTDAIGHGTAVAAAICEGLPPENWELLPVRVFLRRLSAPARCLAAGISWAVREGAGLVNLSAGVRAGSDPEGESLLRRAAIASGEAGATLIAPRRRGGDLLVPGALPRVRGLVGVVADEQLERRQFRCRGRVITAAPWARPLPPLPPQKNFRGVSLAVAAVTNLAARLVLSGKSAPGPGLPDALREVVAGQPPGPAEP